jgi:hypothetical protein
LKVQVHGTGCGHPGLQLSGGVIVTAFWNDPEVFGELVNSLPEETRAVLSPIVLAVVTAIPILTRLLKQRESGPGKT